MDIIKADVQIWQDEFKEMSAYAHAHFDANEQILMKVSLSPVSMEGAYGNMQQELTGWDFEAVAKAADKLWND